MLLGILALTLGMLACATEARDGRAGVVVMGNSPSRHRLSADSLHAAPDLAAPGERAYRFALRNDSSSGDLVFSAFTDDDSFVRLYALKGGFRTEIAVLSRLLPRDRRSMPDLRLSTPVFVSPGSTAEFLITVSSRSPAPQLGVGMERPTFDLWPRDLFVQWSATQRLLYGLYYGAILLMGIYNLFLFFSLRDQSYLWYSLIILVYSLCLSVWDGVAALYLVPGSLSFSTPTALGVLDDLTIIFAFAFTRSFLGLRKIAPRLDRVILIMTVLQAALLPLQAVARLQSFLSIVSITLFLMFVLIVSAIVVSLRNGFRPARYFALGVAGPLVVTVFVASAYFRIGLDIPLYMVGFYISWIVMALLFSLALADRITFLSAERERADRLNLAMTDFFVNISHEIRTPLTLISNYLDEYERGAPPSENLTVIRKNVDKLVRDVTQFFDVQRMSRGIEVYGKGTSDLAEIVRSRVQLLQPTARKAGIGITVCAEGSLAVQAPPAAVERILDNLADNGIKYNRPGGNLRIEARRIAGAAELVVSDTGIGIPATEQEKIFLPYYRVSRPKLNAQGIGMGLALVKRTVTSLGGSISIHSLPEKGTTFAVRFPLAVQKEVAVARGNGTGRTAQVAPAEAPAPSVDREGAAAAVSRPDGGPEVLVVEDDPDLRTLLCARISETFPVRAAANGIEALACLESIDQCCGIISDLMMDGMDGNEFFRRVRSDARLARVPFIFITAMTDPQERLHRLADGAADYVVKPFLIDELALKLFNLVRRSEEEKQARLLEKRRTFEAFLGGLAHAIRNPLSAITGPVANLKKILEAGNAGFDHQRVSTWLRYAEEGAARIVKILSDAEMVLSRPVLKMRPLDVQELARSLESFGARLGITVSSTVATGTCVMGDASAARRILENLLSSAAAALRGAGCVQIAAQRDPGSGSLRAARIILSYAGRPPDAETLARMFEPFFTPRPGDSAIGLYAARELANSMGWEVGAAAPSGEMPGFAVTAPLC
jgi:signal transduction histidine kinase